MLIFVMFSLYLNCVESRVFCQDSNALSWVPRGFTCPVKCASVVQAIAKLQYMDYEKVIRNEIGYGENGEVDLDKIEKKINSKTLLHILRRDLQTQTDRQDNTTDKDPMRDGRWRQKETPSNGFDDINDNELDGLKNKVEQTMQNQMTINNKMMSDNNIDSENNMAINVSKRRKKHITNYNVRFDKYSDKSDSILESDNMSDKNESDYAMNNNMESKIVSNNNMAPDKMVSKSETLSNCWSLEKFERIQLIIKLKRYKCTRRASFEDGFLRMMTDILNKYVDSPFKFNKEITEILLIKILGKTTELRYNIIDVNEFISYLESVIKKHKHHSDLPQIVLKSSYCLTISIFGCFCKSGFVESNGQCVRPSDCNLDATQERYLPRIKVY